MERTNINNSLISILFVLVFIVGCVNIPEPITQDSVSAPTTDVKTKPAIEVETKISTSNQQDVTYLMNQDVTVDYLVYKVTKAETFTEMGTSMMNKKTTGKFIKVYLEITNVAKETKEIFTPRFIIIDNQDRQFDRVSDDMFYIADSINFGQQLQPSLTLSGAIVFELPKDSTDLNLEIRGDISSTKKVKIALSGIQDIGKDTTQKDEQDEKLNGVMEESKEKTRELLNQCNEPFSCSSSCPDMMDVGSKNCPSGKVCCMQ